MRDKVAIITAGGSGMGAAGAKKTGLRRVPGGDTFLIG